MTRIPAQRIVFDRDVQGEILARIATILSSGHVAEGSNVSELERRVAGQTHRRHAIAVSSGGAALELGLSLLGAQGHEVIVPTNTFMATAASVVRTGGSVRLADIEPDTLCLSLETLKSVATARTRGVIVVHIGGIIPPDIDQIRRWCDASGLWLLEDAAHAHGCELHGRPAGSWGTAAAFSFFATKVVTSGEGGVLVLDDDELAARGRILKNYGKRDTWSSYHTEIGWNLRMSEIAAAVAVTHFAKLNDLVRRRSSVACMYTALIEKHCVGLRLILPSEQSSWYKYVVRLPPGISADRVRQKMKEVGVSLAGGVYDIPLHRQPPLIEAPARFPGAEQVCGGHICLPIYPDMAKAEIEFVVDSLLGSLEGRGADG